MAIKLTQAILRDAGIGNCFRPHQTESLGITHRQLQKMVAAGAVERIGRGLYRLAAAEPTEHYSKACVCARVPHAIICLLSALQAHQIGTQLPRQVWIGIPHHAKAPILTGTGIGVQLVRFRNAALTHGISETSYEGVPARITSPARTIVDCFRFQRRIGREAALEALREAHQDRKVTTAELMRILEVLPSRRLRIILESGIL